MEKEYGIIYLLSNPAFPHLLKIGQTSRLELKKRIDELSRPSGVPDRFRCEYACRVELRYLNEIEKALHAAFDDNRKNKSREFFEVPKEQVIPIMKALDNFSNDNDATSEVQDILEQASYTDDGTENTKKRPVFDFISLGIKEGDELHFVGKDKNDSRCITCTVADHRRVHYNGELCYLTSITTDLLGYVAAPLPYWKTKDGVFLNELYDKKYKND